MEKESSKIIFISGLILALVIAMISKFFIVLTPLFYIIPATIILFSIFQIKEIPIKKNIELTSGIIIIIFAILLILDWIMSEIDFLPFFN